MLDAQGRGVRATRTATAAGQAASLFQWATSPYSAAALTQAGHPHELTPSPHTVHWRLDVETAGVGTGACGPGVAKQYQVKCRKVEFGFRLDPVLA